MSLHTLNLLNMALTVSANKPTSSSLIQLVKYTTGKKYLNALYVKPYEMLHSSVAQIVS